MSLTVDAPKTVPQAASSPAPASAEPADVSPGPTVVQTDTASGPDQLARARDAAFLAELVAHKNAGTPLCIGLFGPAGTGKSRFLCALLDAVRRLGQAADDAGLATPFVGNLAVIPVTAQAGVSPAAALIRQVLAGLAATHPKLALEVSHAGLDPRAAAREAAERLNEVRQRLDTERRTLDELSGRQARLVDNVLFEAAGSRVDAYARAHRARIDRSLKRFGFQGETNATFKELVREASEPGGSLATKPGWTRAFWAYRGQTRLIVIALLFFLLAWGLGALIANEDELIDSLRASSGRMGSTADWLTAHAGWLEPVKQLLEIAGVVTLAMNVARGVRFLQPLIKGASLLRGDLETRRRDIDSLLAHQTRRVDGLANEAEAAGQHAAEAEARVAAAGTAGALPALSSRIGRRQGDTEDRESARQFFAAVGSAMAAAANDRLPSSASAAPMRLVVGIDGLDRLPSDAAADFLTTARGLLDQPGIVVIVAGERSHLVAGLSETDPALAATQLNRVVQIPYAVGSEAGAWADSGDFVQALLRGDGAGADVIDESDASASALDRPWLKGEAAVLKALAPSAGGTPRAVKRFVNLYRVARADPRMRGATAQDLAALALGLALQSAGSTIDFAALAMPFSPGWNDDVQAARHAVTDALGAPLDLAAAKCGLETARLYDARG